MNKGVKLASPKKYEEHMLDPLTGVLKRDFFFREAGKILDNIQEEWLLIVLDVENFKLFNDWYGWNKGNEILVGIGKKLEEISIAKEGLAGYLKDDDFCLLVREKSIDIHILFNEIDKVIKNQGASVGFLPSFGVSRADARISARELFDQASMAMNRAKGDFKNRIIWFSREMVDEQENEFETLSDFQKALKEHKISFYLQPQCRASTGDIVGAEALARWINPDGTRIPPVDFVPVLEKYGFVTDLDKYIWEEVAAWISRWIGKGNPLLPISVNVSQVNIFTLDVPGFFQDLVNRYSLPWNAIKIEITESACAEDTHKVRETVRKLRSMGFLVMMDDFGSGYSSLNMLHELEVDAIKLDARFLHYRKQSEEKGIHIVETVVNMAKTMGLPIIVEGVESFEQKEFLMHLGCRYVQGFYFYKPMRLEEFEKLIINSSRLDLRGFLFKANEQFGVRELLDNTVYSDSMLNSILGPVAIYSWKGDSVDIIRFNEEFYEAVSTSDFQERLKGIEKYMPGEDIVHMKEALQKAVNDRMNGSTAVLNFFRSEGGASRFLIHFYYLGEEGDSKRFYGSARDVTDITLLQRHVDLISRLSSECILFVDKRKEGIHFHVAAHGLEEETGIPREKLEDELNSMKFFDRIVPEQRESVLRHGREAMIGINFSSYFTMINAQGKRIKLFLKSDYVEDETSDICCVMVVSRKHKRF